MSLYGAIDKSYMGRHVTSAAEGVADSADIDTGIASARCVIVDITTSAGFFIAPTNVLLASTGILTVQGSFTNGGADLINWIVVPE